MRPALASLALPATLLLACSSNGGATLSPADAGADAPPDVVEAAAPDAATSPRGFAAVAPWAIVQAGASDIGDLARVASTFRVLVVDADPDLGRFDDAQIATLHADGKNRVLSVLDVGACSSARTYWTTVPAGFVSCSANTAAQLGAYHGAANAQWMNPADADWQKLVIELVAARLAQRKIDGFWLVDFDLVEHTATSADGPCDAACRQGGLDLVRVLRDRFPDLDFVMKDATSDVTRLATTGGVTFPSLLDGVVHDAVYQPGYDAQAEKDLMQWVSLGLHPGGNAFFVGDLEYVGDCSNSVAAQSAYQAARTKGFSPYATDRADGQKQICFWGF